MNIESLKDTEFRIIPEPFQGSEEWLALRRTKITATDARVIMEVDPWKTKRQLYDEKMGKGTPKKTNFAMQRGLDLENDIILHLEQKYGVPFRKATVVRGWCLASLDAVSSDGNIIAEIKCPGKKDHDLAISGQVPEKYYPQLQFALHVTGLDLIYYESSADGESTESVVVERNQVYIDEMIEKCYEFYESVTKMIPPEPDENDFVEQESELWKSYADKYRYLQGKIEEMENEKKNVKNQLIYLSMSKNSKGGGLILQEINRKGMLDYERLLKKVVGIDIEQYRKPSSKEWRITIQ